MCTQNPPRKHKVLLIEDDPLFHELAEAVLAGHCALFIASTIEEGTVLLAAHDDISIVILDGHVPLSRHDPRMGSTLPLAEDLMHTRSGQVTLFAASGDPLLNAAFVHVGAVPTDKSTAYAAVARLLHRSGTVGLV
jgi:DNA-binding NarL/FixJ family response regulator